ncbi:hypothetical protein BDN71DRAFT_1509766 [Pleurotus eryngii]|uniref:Uncharacterized protein n=1 Tax=Pleurotus eryngii TaxID=5323 RepID=A0A9P5ZRC2_PLEER|nr:hypothetical protein BDN71DRAFT_1509766 [Pleurotus eryngii]
MRVSASSSFLIATLAISTSSPCLGAPTVDQQGDRLSSFNSVRDVARQPINGKVTATGPPQGYAHVTNGRSFDARELQRRGLLKSLLGGLPLIGPLVAGVDDTLCGGASGQAFGAESVDSGPTEEQMVQMMEAAYTLSSVFASATKATPLPLASSTANTISTATSTPAPTGTEASTGTATTETGSSENAMATPVSAESDSDSRILVAPDSDPASSTTALTSTVATEMATDSFVSTSTDTSSTSTVVAEGILTTSPPLPNTPSDASKPTVTPPDVPIGSTRPPVPVDPSANSPLSPPVDPSNPQPQPTVSPPARPQTSNLPVQPEAPKTPDVPVQAPMLT